MSASRAKKVKMATKSCPECDQQVPVACKSCPCGYVFINRKFLKINHSVKSSSFTDVNNAVSLKGNFTWFSLISPKTLAEHED
ncbi:hypothetical protein mRhiFer1_009202 [Rhinolophus ferrumequinum]|uniref:UPF0547 domain-containing protein n=1 Tax=Rhinolophus ferrumequinum TaxID=59479 RepID=A0A7J7SJE5_RHIFE|nr:hypothetical protein mRhiFer1_009202 [Rhinolophus ferrumequinum]